MISLRPVEQPGTTFQIIVVDSGLRPVDTARIEIS